MAGVGEGVVVVVAEDFVAVGVGLTAAGCVVAAELGHLAVRDLVVRPRRTAVGVAAAGLVVGEGAGRGGRLARGADDVVTVEADPRFAGRAGVADRRGRRRVVRAGRADRGLKRVAGRVLLMRVIEDQHAVLDLFVTDDHIAEVNLRHRMHTGRRVPTDKPATHSDIKAPRRNVPLKLNRVIVGDRHRPVRSNRLGLVGIPGFVLRTTDEAVGQGHREAAALN